MILAWLMTVWGRRLMVAVAVVGLLAGARWYYIKEGESRGRAAAAEETKTQIEAERIDSRKQVTEALAQSAAAMEAAQKRFEDAQAQLYRQQVTIAQLVGKRQQQQTAVAAIPEQGLHDFNTQTLGIRKANDATLGYYPAEEREIAKCLSDRPLCEQQSKTTADALHTAQTQVSSLQEQITTMASRDAALLGYANSVETLYVQLYNSTPRKRNWFLTIITFGLAGKAKPLSLPDPLTLQRRRQILFPETQ